MFLSMNGDVWKDIIRGVIMTSLVFVLALYIPILGFIGLLFLPLPVCYCRYKQDRNAAGLMAAVSIMIMMIMMEGFSFDLAFFAGLLLLGFILGDSMARGLSVERTILYPSAAVTGAGVMLLLIFSIYSHTNFGDLIQQYVKQNLQMTTDLYRQMGMPEKTLQTLSESMQTIQDTVTRIIPGIVVMSVLFITWINLLLARSLARLRGLTCPDIGDLTLWKSPEVLVWGAIAGGCLLLMPVSFLEITGLNIILILIMIYFFHGISVVSFYFEKRKLPKPVRIILYGLIGIQQVFSILVVGLGFFDMWLDFRKIKQAKS